MSWTRPRLRAEVTTMLLLNWLDISLVLVILWSAVSGLRAGLARVVIGLVATVVGLVAGFWCYRLVAAKLLPWVKTDTLANILGISADPVGRLILGTLIASHALQRFQVDRAFLVQPSARRGRGCFARCADRLRFVGLLRRLFAFSDSLRYSNTRRCCPYVSQLSGWLVDLAPRELKDAFTQQIQNLRQIWSNPPKKSDAEV